eukprot:9013481-Pyramimonas_sp.AAC.1
MANTAFTSQPEASSDTVERGRFVRYGARSEKGWIHLRNVPVLEQVPHGTPRFEYPRRCRQPIAMVPKCVDEP